MLYSHNHTCILPLFLHFNLGRNVITTYNGEIFSIAGQRHLGNVQQSGCLWVLPKRCVVYNHPLCWCHTFLNAFFFQLHIYVMLDIPVKSHQCLQLSNLFCKLYNPNFFSAICCILKERLREQENILKCKYNTPFWLNW